MKSLPLISCTTAHQILKHFQSGHFFGLELFSGHLYLHLNMGTGHVKIRVSQGRIDDGVWHNFHTERTGQFGKVTLDGQGSDFVVPGWWGN